MSRRELIRGLGAALSMALAGCTSIPETHRVAASDLARDYGSVDLHAHPGMFRSSPLTMESQVERMGRGRVKTVLFAAVADGPLIGRRPSGGLYATREPTAGELPTATWWQIDQVRARVTTGALKVVSGPSDMDALLRGGGTGAMLAAEGGDFHLGDRLSPRRRRSYERAIACGDRLADRHRTRRDLTVVHSDAHVRNSLHSPDGDVRVIDWDDWRLAPPTHDLAYMMAVHWYPERHHRLEDALLRHYLQALADAGVRGYGLDTLRHDYWLAVVRQLGVPVFQHSAKLPVAIWWSHLERIFLAFDDLGCEELLTG